MALKGKNKDETKREIDGLLETIGSKLGNGNPEDYEIEYDLDDPHEIIAATPKEDRDRVIAGDLSQLNSLLDKAGFSIDEARIVFLRLDRLIIAAAIPFSVVDYSDLIPVGESHNPYNGPSYEPRIANRDFYPRHVRLARGALKFASSKWLETKIVKDIEPLPLPDRKAELARRLDRVEIRVGESDRMKMALEKIQKRVKRDLEIEIERATDLKRLRLQPVDEFEPGLKAKGKANKDAGELTVEQAVIFFHYFFEIIEVRPDLTAAKKIEVIQSVTRWSRDSIANIIYDKKGGGVFRKGNGDDFTTFEADMKAIKGLYQKLQLPEVVALIENDIEDIGGNL